MGTAMKPTRHKVYCHAARKYKLLFGTRQKAENCVRFNAQGLQLKPYYCETCMGWHLTSQNRKRNNRWYIDTIVGAMYRDKENKKTYNQIKERSKL